MRQDKQDKVKEVEDLDGLQVSSGIGLLGLFIIFILIGGIVWVTWQGHQRETKLREENLLLREANKLTVRYDCMVVPYSTIVLEGVIYSYSNETKLFEASKE